MRKKELEAELRRVEKERDYYFVLLNESQLAFLKIILQQNKKKKDKR
jgi:hypothetical protein